MVLTVELMHQSDLLGCPFTLPDDGAHQLTATFARCPTKRNPDFASQGASHAQCPSRETHCSWTEWGFAIAQKRCTHYHSYEHYKRPWSIIFLYCWSLNYSVAQKIRLRCVWWSNLVIKPMTQNGTMLGGYTILLLHSLKSVQSIYNPRSTLSRCPYSHSTVPPLNIWSQDFLKEILTTVRNGVPFSMYSTNCTPFKVRPWTSCYWWYPHSLRNDFCMQKERKTLKYLFHRIEFTGFQSFTNTSIRIPAYNWDLCSSAECSNLQYFML